MKTLLSALAIAALLVATASVATASAATETVSLGASEDTSAEPAPFFEPPAVLTPVSFKVTYTATPVQPLSIITSIYCTVGSEHPGAEEPMKTVTPPATVTLTAPHGSESCLLAAQAEPVVGTTVPGSARIEAEAVRTVADTAQPPSQKKKAKL